MTCEIDAKLNCEFKRFDYSVSKYSIPTSRIRRDARHRLRNDIGTVLPRIYAKRFEISIVCAACYFEIDFIGFLYSLSFPRDSSCRRSRNNNKKTKGRNKTKSVQTSPSNVRFYYQGKEFSISSDRWKRERENIFFFSPLICVVD